MKIETIKKRTDVVRKSIKLGSNLKEFRTGLKRLLISYNCMWEHMDKQIKKIQRDMKHAQKDTSSLLKMDKKQDKKQDKKLKKMKKC